MSIQTNDNFEVNAPKPIDNRFVVGGNNFYQNKEDIDYKYEGLRIWDLNDNEPYYWTGTAWSSENVAGSVTVQTAITGFLTKFIGAGGEIEASLLFQGSNKIGINTQAPQKTLHIRQSGILIDGANAVESAPNLERFIINTGTSTNQNFLSFKNDGGVKFYVGAQGASINTDNLSGSRFRVNGSVLIGSGETPPINGLLVQGKSIFDGEGTNDGMVEIGDKSISATTTPSSKKRLVIYDSQNHISLVQRSADIGLTTIENKGWSISTSDVDVSTFQIRYLEEGDTSDPKFTINNQGFVGIGVNTASTLFQVSGAINGYITNIENTNASGNGLLVKSGSSASLNANILRLTNSQNDNNFIVKADGRVGIGTYDPLDILHVEGKARFMGTNTIARYEFTTQGTDNNHYSQINLNSGGNIFSEGNGGAYLLYYGDGRTRLWNRANADLSFGTNNLERMIIKSGGRIGIGTNLPTEPDCDLHIKSNSTTRPLIIESTTGSNMEFWAPQNDHTFPDGVRIGRIGSAADSNVFDVQASGTGQILRLLGRDQIRFWVDGDSRVYINSDGRVGIGTSNPDSLLHVRTTEARVAVLESTNSGNANMEFISGDGSNGDIGIIGSQYRIRTDGANLRIETGSVATNQVVINETAYIRRNGYSGFGKNSNPQYGIHLPNDAGNIGTVRAYEFSTISDSRVKSDVTTIKYGLDTIMSLKPSQYYHHKSSGDDKIIIHKEGKFDIGLIAQDVEKIIPEIVNVPENKESELYGLSYAKITPVLIKAIQDQQSIIENLKSRVKKLES